MKQQKTLKKQNKKQAQSTKQEAPKKVYNIKNRTPYKRIKSLFEKSNAEWNYAAEEFAKNMAFIIETINKVQKEIALGEVSYKTFTANGSVILKSNPLIAELTRLQATFHTQFKIMLSMTGKDIKSVKKMADDDVSALHRFMGIANA